MFIIEKISVHPKDPSIFHVHFLSESGDRSALPIYEDLMIKYMLRKGLELSRDELESIQRETDLWKIYLSAINYLSYRMRSRAELKKYLLSKEFDSHAIEQVLMRLESENYLDDQAFAVAFVRTRMKTSTKGPLMIARELKDSGVNSKDTEHALTLYTKEKQIENAGKYLSKKMTSGASKRSIKEQYLRASRLLMQRGFQRDVTEVVLKSYEADDTEEWSAIQYQGDKAVKKYEKLEPWERKYKIKQFLFRKGFQTDMIQKYVDQMDE